LAWGQRSLCFAGAGGIVIVRGSCVVIVIPNRIVVPFRVTAIVIAIIVTIVVVIAAGATDDKKE
jgi:hypothetical protein